MTNVTAPDWEVPVLGGSAAVEPVRPPGAGAGAGSYGTPQMTCSTAKLWSRVDRVNGRV